MKYREVKNKYFRYGEFIKQNKYKLLLLFLLMVLSLTSNLILPQFIGMYLDNINSPKSNLILIAVLFIIAILVRLLFSILTSFFSENLGVSISNNIREKLTRHCINLDMSFHNKISKGSFIDRIDSDISFLGDFFSSCLVGFSSSILIVVGIMIILSLINVNIFFAMLLPNIAIVMALIKFHAHSVYSWVAKKKTSSKLYGLIQEDLQSKDEICSRRAQDYIIGKLRGCLENFLIVSRKAALDTNKSLVFINITYFISNGLGFGVAVFLFINQKLSLGELYLVYNYQSLLYGPWQQLRYQVSVWSQASASLDRINELFDTKSEVVSGNKDFKIEGSDSAIEFKDVCFGYEKDVPVLNDINFSLPIGKKLGIVGKTGGGKSTIINLLMHLYKVTSGTILLNGENITDISDEQLRKNVLLVSQSTSIFNDTFKNNITFMKDGYSDTYLLDCINNLNLSDWFSKFRNGLATQISDSSLSRGETQIISLIRAYVVNPFLIVLDEATAHLDPYTESLINSAYYKLLNNKTAIIVAHRLKTLENVDYILVIDKGIVVEYGEQDKLVLDTKSVYYRLLTKELKEVQIS